MYSRINYIIILIFISSFSITAQKYDSFVNIDERETSSFTLIEKAYNSGRIDLDKRIEYFVKAKYDPEDLPEEFRGAVEAKCGTWYYNLIFKNWKKLKEQTRIELSRYGFNEKDGTLSRPTVLDKSASTQHFKIHFTTDPSDTNHIINDYDGNYNGIPDYVDNMMGAFEKSYSSIMDELGFAPPPGDSLTTADYGGDNKYDVYIVKISGTTYGVTHPEMNVKDNPNSTPVEVNAATSFIRVRNEYNNYSAGWLGALQVTAAHEFLHAVQYGVDYAEKAWLFESTAAWVEGFVYPDVDDNFQYLNKFFLNPYQPLDATNAELKNHWYSSWIFFQYLSEHYGNIIVREIWDASRNFDSETGDFSFNAIETALASYLTNFVDIFRDFIIANLVKTDFPYNYNQAEFYPDVHITKDIFAPYQNHTYKLKRRASRYFRVSPNLIPKGTDEIKFVASPKTALSELGFVIITKQGNNFNYNIFPPSSNVNFTLNNTKNLDDIYFAAYNPSGTEKEYKVSIITSSALHRIQGYNFQYSQTNLKFNVYQTYETFYLSDSPSDSHTYYKLKIQDIIGHGNSSYNFGESNFTPYLSETNNSNMIVKVFPQIYGLDFLYSLRNGSFKVIALSDIDTTKGYPHYSYLNQITVTGDSAYIIGDITVEGGSAGWGIWNVNLTNSAFSKVIAQGESEYIQGMEIDRNSFCYEIYNSSTDTESLYRYHNEATPLLTVNHSTQDLRRFSYKDDIIAFHMYDKVQSTDKFMMRDFSGADSIITLAANNNLDGLSIVTNSKRVAWAEVRGSIWNSNWKLKFWENGTTTQFYTNNRFIMQQVNITPNLFDQRLSISNKGIAWMEMNVYNAVEYYFYYYQFSNSTVYTVDLSGIFGREPELKIDLLDDYAVISVLHSQSADFWGGIFVLTLNDIITTVEKEENVVPLSYKLYQNYPNPFNPETTIKFDLPSNQQVKLEIFDILGRKVRTVVNDVRPAGSYNIKFNAKHLASGVYLYRLKTGDFIKTRKMIILK